MRIKMDLRQSDNPGCQKCADRRQRDRCTNAGICGVTSAAIDGGLVRCVGDWGQEKVYYLLQYLGIFANSMHHSWSGLNYIEICSGPGRNINYRTWSEHDGSSLAVLRHPTYKHIKCAKFIDYDERVVNQLNARIATTGIGNAEAVPVDYMDAGQLERALRRLPTGHLNLVFIDPTDLSFPFTALRLIAEVLPKADLIMTVAIGMDFNRNAERAAMLSESAVRAKYETFLGWNGFFDSIRTEDGRPATEMTVDELRENFTSAFRDRLASLGYIYTAEKSIRHYYDLVFASRDPKGLEFWDKACSIGYGGQRLLPLGEN
jgi:three-Cys-motif partner protein